MASNRMEIERAATSGRERLNSRHKRLGPWARFTLNRAVGLLVSFALLVIITFLIVPLIPGDPAVAAAGEGASSAQIDQMREDLGLNQPILMQFQSYLRGIFTLDLGRSFANDMDVSELVFSRLPFTAAIAFLAIALVLLIGVPLGLFVAVMTRGGRAKVLDRSFDLVTGLVFTMPHYVTATLLVLVFAITLGWFPSGGAENLSSLVLPTTVLAMGPACVVARVVRRESAVVMEQDYIRTARGWRIPPARMHLRYVLPNLLNTTLTLSGLILAGMLGGAVVIETVFAWPGLGLGIVNAILARDYPVIRAIILVLGLLATLLIILVDVLLAVIDPRNLETRDNHG